MDLNNIDSISNEKKVLVTGSNGLLGQKIVYHLIQKKDIELIASSKGPNRLAKNKTGYKYFDLDLTDKNAVEKIIFSQKPDSVVNCAAMTNVDACEINQLDCWNINVNAVEYLAYAVEKINGHLLHLVLILFLTEQLDPTVNTISQIHYIIMLSQN